MTSETLQLSLPEDHGRRIHDPSSNSVYHFEAYLPFSEAAKLRRGNANVRPAHNNHPVRAMLETVHLTPELFHLKNRGITYLCEKFFYDSGKKRLLVAVPDIAANELNEEGAPRFGIADGGHTFSVVEQTMGLSALLREDADWREPFVRVHFIAGDDSAIGIAEVVEALNTSIQVKTFTLEEYKGQFDSLKAALVTSGFDLTNVAFRENEDKEWTVTEVIQRLALFLKDRWRLIPPTSMYRAKEKALQLFLTNQNDEFTRLYSVIREIVTLPEYIQSALPDYAEAKRLGGVKGVRRQKKPFQRPSTHYTAHYKMDGAIVLPMAAAFRVLLRRNESDQFVWSESPYEVFNRCAPDLYSVLLNRIRRVRSASQLVTDQEYWVSCEKVVLTARND
jgi:hypothetical protein